MKGSIYVAGILLVLFYFAPAQEYEIIRTKLTGTGVQADSAWWITGFQNETDGEYVYLRPIRQGGVLLQPIFKSRLAGIGVDAFITSGDTLVGFSTSGPDANGYVYLNAIMKSGATQAIFRSKLEGCDVQDVSPVAGQWINEFRTSGPDPDGYVYLKVVRKTIGIEEEKRKDSEMALNGFTFALNSPAPNPFINKTRISYSIAKPCKVEIKVFDITGRVVKTLINKNSQNPNVYTILWNGEDNEGRRLNSGIFFIRMKAGDFSATKKVMLLK
ncbi:MAG: T9SS type A sorting domain-containing protein [candidate division WOR-3 bacterium]